MFIDLSPETAGQVARKTPAGRVADDRDHTKASSRRERGLRARRRAGLKIDERGVFHRGQFTIAWIPIQAVSTSRVAAESTHLLRDTG
jgi:hypothetical protein